MIDGETMIRERLMSLADSGYRDFQAKLMPNVDKETVIGVRMPDIRRLAKELWGTREAEEFLNALMHKY